MKKIKNIILFVLFCSVILKAQIVYKIPVGTAENTIKIKVTNSTIFTMENVEVKLLSEPEWIKFKQEAVSLEKISSQSSKDAVFYFDVETASPIEEEGTIIFNVQNTNGKSLQKSFKVQAVLPDKFELFQNFPNPFNPATTIKYSIAEEGFVNLTVFNILGEKVATLVSKNMKPGRYTVDFDANNLSTGIYVYRLDSGKNTSVKKIILMK